MAAPTLADLLQGRGLRNPLLQDPDSILLGRPPPSSRNPPTPRAELNAHRPTLADYMRNGLRALRFNPHSADAVAGLVPWTPMGAAHQGGQDIAEGLGTGNLGQAGLGLGGTILAALPFGLAPRTGAALTMDRASRMSRARQLGYSERPFYRGDRGIETEYPGGGFFSRDLQTAAGHARRHQRTPDASPREFRLNLNANFDFAGSLTREQRDRIVAAVATENPRLATEIGAAIDEGTPLGLLYQALDRGTSGAGGVLRRAGFNSVDTGRDVLMLSGSGIRSAEAAFDPALAASRNIFHGLGLPLATGAATSPLWMRDGAGN